MKIRILLSAITLTVAALFFVSCSDSSRADNAVADAQSDFSISLAQWSLHKTYFGGNIEDWQWFGRMVQEDPDALLKGEDDPFEFPKIAAEMDIECIELVNTFYMSKANDMDYWAKFKKNCEDSGVTVGLIMCDALGNIGDADEAARMQAVENHHQWVDIAEYLGAKTIRVNAGGSGTAEEVAANAVDGLKKLGQYAAQKGINVVVENHGGYSSNGAWLAGVMQSVGMENVGTLPDFGNFCIERGPDGCVNEYDKYLGMAEIVPFAKGVSAKSHVFDENGNETNTDFLKMMQIVKDSGFKGWVGIEYEGWELPEKEGILATKALLEKVFAELE